MPAPDNRLPARGSADALHSHRITEDWLEDKAVTAAKLAPSTFGGTPSAIDPDDVASSGSTGLVSDAGHQHAYTASAPSSLTKTATNSEGSGATHVRNDHAHATDALPWGKAGVFSSTSNGSALSTGNTSDFSITATFDSARLYEVCLHSQYTPSADATLSWELFEDGSLVARMDRVGNNSTAIAKITNCSILYEPSSGSHTIDIRVTVSSGTVTFNGAAVGTLPGPRRFWVKDIGPR